VSTEKGKKTTFCWALRAHLGRAELGRVLDQGPVLVQLERGTGVGLGLLTGLDRDLDVVEGMKERAPRRGHEEGGMKERA
jgi:hypothetical protein